MAQDFTEAQSRLLKAVIAECKEKLLNINNYTSYHSIRSFTPAEIEIVFKHLNKCHELIIRLADILEYEMPYKIPALIMQARHLEEQFK